VDESVLTLQRGDKTIPLVLGRDVTYSELTAHLIFAIDRTTYAVKIGSRFEVKGRKCEVIGIDSQDESVVIKREQDGQELLIRKLPQADNRAAPEHEARRRPWSQGDDSL
jgi:hypothetical protein